VTFQIETVPFPDWIPHPHPGCQGTEIKVFLKLDHLVIAMLRIPPNGTIHEHPAPFDADVICLEGKGMTSVGGEQGSLKAGQRIRWPANVPHRLWTEDSEMITLMVEHLPGRGDGVETAEEQG
jgi:quercetin dioxygenase-like cupin family protein